jgi:DNA-binding CsgD family transcriptional regulator
MDLLTESIYDAAIEPAGWARVMAMLKGSFSTGAETLYFLDYNRHRLRPVHVCGVEERFLRTFNTCFYADDNPFTRAPALHLPGVVRTDEDILAHVGDPGMLGKSKYYNDWLRPQDFRHTMGTTLLAEDGVMLNLSLLRSAGVGSYGAREVADFKRLCRHLRRGFRVAMRLETLASRRRASFEALDHLRHGVAFLGPRDVVLHCNSAAEAILRKGDGLTVRNGRLAAVETTAHRGLRNLLRSVAQAGESAVSASPSNLTVHRRRGRPLTVSAIRLSERGASLVSERPMVMLMIAEPDSVRRPGFERIRRLYGLTPAESRLAKALLTGNGLRHAAEEAQMTYETARWYLKILFQKTGTRRQAELVARLLGDLVVPWRAGRESD